MMDVLLVGSIAYDSVKTPMGEVENALGGSAVYGGIASKFHANLNGLNSVGLVGVVGTDFRETDIQLMSDMGIDLSGLEIAEGQTFRWEGSYHGDMGIAETHDTHLNVFGQFNPKVPQESKNPKVLFCANLLPMIQAAVIKQTNPTRITMLDSMNLWIQTAKQELIDVMKQVELIIINDGEVKMLAEDDNLIRASTKVIDMVGVQTLVIKKGEHGVLAFHGNQIISLPAYPTDQVVDPTGCGDSFAGTIAANLAKGEGDLTKDELRNALIRATVTASFTLGDFGINALKNLTEEAFNSRLDEYLRMLN